MARSSRGQSGDYLVVVQKVANPFTRNVEAASKLLAEQVNQQIALGWQPEGGIAIGSAGTAPYLLQAMIKRR